MKLWDLRKLKNFKSVEAAGVKCVRFDLSGHYLAVGGADACVHNVKAEWEVVKRWEASKAPVNALEFAADAKALYAGCGDHNLRVSWRMSGFNVGVGDRSFRGHMFY